VISVTSDANSNLAKNSDSVILVKPDENKEMEEMAPLGTVFEDATLLFFDTLVPGLMKRLDLSEKDMRNNHAIWV
jgi:6-phospho-3-hexuloisomerase